MPHRRESWAVRLYRWRLRACAAPFRARYEDEIVESFATLLERERADRGVIAALMLWGRGMQDAASTVRVERPDRAGVMGGWSADVRQTARAVRRYPVFAAVVVLTLGLAIGGVTAVFAIADPLLFRPLPYPDANRIVQASIEGPGAFGFAQVADYAMALHARSLSVVGSYLDAYQFRPPEGQPSGPDPFYRGYSVTDGFLSLLGVQPAAGRVFTHAEYDAVAPNATGFDGRPALITDRVWREQFNRAPDAVGGVLKLRNARGGVLALTIVGVLRPDFIMPDISNAPPGFLVPGAIDLTAAPNPNRGVELYARLAPGATLAQAAAEVQHILVETERSSAAIQPGRTVTFLRVQDALVGSTRTPLLTLLAVTVLILILATASLAHLYLARLAGRAKELAVRRALGAGGWRILRLLLTESGVLAAAGGLMAVGVGKGLFVAVMSVMPRFAHVYRLMPASFDARVIIVTAALTLGALLVTGLWPAVLTLRQPAAAMKAADVGMARARRRRDAVLLALQSALAMSVLVVSALIVGSYARLNASMRGIDLSGLSSLTVTLPGESLRNPPAAWQQLTALGREVNTTSAIRLSRTRGVPGESLPGGVWRADDEAMGKPQVIGYPNDRGALNAMRIHLIRGRLYSDDESDANAAVAVVDERAARMLWPGQEPIGQIVREKQSASSVPRVVIGVVETVNLDFGAAPAQGSAFMPIDPAGRVSGTFVWRGPTSAALVESVRTAAARLAPGAQVNGESMTPLERPLGQPRLMARLLGVLGGLALVLTITGIYSVVSHGVAGRRSEIGVRMALGATSAGVRRLIVRESVAPALAGIALGTVLCLWWTEAIRKLLFQMGPRDPAMFVAAGALVCLVAIAGSVVPARRASRVDPVVALRAE